VKRYLFNLIVGLSVLLCVAVGAFWLRSYWVCDGFVGAEHGDLIEGRFAWGQLAVLKVYGLAKPNAHVFRYVRWTSVDDGGSFWLGPGMLGDGPQSHWRLMGFYFEAGTQDTVDRKMVEHSYRYSKTYWPYWPVAGAAAWPLWFLVVKYALRLPSYLRHRRMLKIGMCPACGYDLRATPDRCPECGRPAN
jgi:hypothetical protein